MPLFRSVIFEFVRVYPFRCGTSEEEEEEEEKEEEEFPGGRVGGGNGGRFADSSDTIIIISIMISCCCCYLASRHCYDRISDLWGFVLPLENRRPILNPQSAK